MLTGCWEGWQLSSGVLTGKYYQFTLLCKRNQSPAASCQPERSSYHVPKVPCGLQDVFCSAVPGRRHLAASSFGPACSREAPGSSAPLEQGSKTQAGLTPRCWASPHLHRLQTLWPVWRDSSGPKQEKDRNHTALTTSGGTPAPLSLCLISVQAESGPDPDAAVLCPSPAPPCAGWGWNPTNFALAQRGWESKAKRGVLSTDFHLKNKAALFRND